MIGAEISEAAWIQRGSTWMVRTRGSVPDPTLRPVLDLHGWSSTNNRDVILEVPVRFGGGPSANGPGHLSWLRASGRTIYYPYSGSNWGTDSVSNPALGGTGLVAIDDAIAQAEADGHDVSTVDIYGTSGGGCNALNWAWRNPDRIHRVFLDTPAVNLADAYDRDALTISFGLGPISASMRAVHGGTDKPSWLPLSEQFDPYRNQDLIAPIADRLTVWAAGGDEVVDSLTLEEMFDNLGVPITWSGGTRAAFGGGHFFNKNGPNPFWDPLMPLRHFHE